MTEYEKMFLKAVEKNPEMSIGSKRHVEIVDDPVLGIKENVYYEQEIPTLERLLDIAECDDLVETVRLVRFAYDNDFGYKTRKPIKEVVLMAWMMYKYQLKWNGEEWV